MTPATGAVSTYLYDASGQRFVAISGTSATVYMGAWEATDPNTTDGSGADVSVTRFYSADGVQLASITTGGVLTATLGDVQGSAQVTVDGSGQVTRNAYTPYGVKRAGSNVASAHGWLNQIADADTGLTYLNARYYDPALGRFLSPDPLLNPGDPRTLDPYRYADNNPVVYLDETGLFPCASMMSFAMGLMGYDCGGNHQTANNAGQVTGGFAEGSRGYVDETKRALSAEGAKAVISDVSKYGAGAPTAWAVEGFADNAMHVGMASQSLVAYQMYGDSRSLRQIGYYSAQPVIDGTIAYNSALLAGMGATGAGLGGAVVRGASRLPKAIPDDLVRVGRWMSLAEYKRMLTTGHVVENIDGRTFAVYPASPATYAAGRGVYVEFDVPKQSIHPGGAPGYVVIPGPGITTEIFGPPPPKPAPATNIQWRRAR